VTSGRDPDHVPARIRFRVDLRGLFAEILAAAHETESRTARRLQESAEIIDLAARGNEGDLLSLVQYVAARETDVAPRILRYSSIVSTFILVESALSAICHELQREDGFSLNLADLSGKGLDQCRKFLTRVAGVDLSELDPEWRQFSDWRRIRNCIVHANGDLSRAGDSGVIRQAMTRLDGVSESQSAWSHGGEIKIDAGAVEGLIQSGKSFVMGIMDRVFGPLPPDPLGKFLL